MTKIRIPYSFKKLQNEIAPSDFIPLLTKYKTTTVDGQYLHWDKFKWKVDKGDDENAAWFATKIARNIISHKIADLWAKSKNDYFSFCVPDSLFAQLHSIDKLTGGGQAISDDTFMTSGERGKYLVKNLMMEEAITSSQLEGASTTRKVAKLMLQSNRKPTNKSEQMILNNFLLMRKSLEQKDQPLSIEFILELHLIATNQAIDNDAIPGELRADNNTTVSNFYNEVAHVPPCYSSLKERLTDLCNFANYDHDGQQFIHPLIKAIILHFMIGYIHPFGDGNGRTARALFYWFMLKSGYWLFEYVSISKLIQEKRSDYDKAYIYSETDDFDLTYFIYHQVDIVTKAVNQLQRHIQAKKQDLYQFMDWIENNPLSKKLKRIQLELLKEAIQHPGRVFSAQQVASDFDITENTARTYLNQLVREELLMPSKTPKSKTVLYLSPQGLAEKIKVKG